MEEQKKTSKAPFIGGCVVGLVVGFVFCCLGIGIISFGSYQARMFRQASRNVALPGDYRRLSNIETFNGQYQLADADAVKEFNSRLKKWFVDRGFKELEDMPLRSVQRMQIHGGPRNNVWESGVNGWDMPGVVLLLKYDDRNSLYILVPDCYRRDSHIQQIGYRSDFFRTSDTTRDCAIQLDRLKDDFERAFPSGNYKNGLPDDMPK
ncbi:MAG: hypothetical protein LBI05_02450 [Planctomycetaceae bacterium]|jgi:hypothetical protein|nr:hypothetical protein [Planctomycetaceae bacterium]